jgi:hypothetical protein
LIVRPERTGVAGALRACARRSPRASSAILFGGATAAVTHVAWVAGARTNGLAPALTIAAGAAHAVAALFTAGRLLDEARTRSMADAAIVGAFTSLLALAIFSPLFATFLYSGGLQASSAVGVVMAPLLVALFTFLAIGWALLLVSAAVGCALYRLVSS